MEKMMAIPAILANQIKRRNPTLIFAGQETKLTEDITLVRKGMKYFLKGEESDIKTYLRMESHWAKSLVAKINHA